MFGNSFGGTPLADSYGTSITPKNYGNGRVEVSNPSAQEQFQLFDRIDKKNKSTSYYDALNGEQEQSQLSWAFFSKENMQILQNGLRAGVYEKSGGQFVLPPQNTDALKIIMRSTFLQYGQLLGNTIQEQIARLNKIVLDYIVPVLYSSSVSYKQYLVDQSTLVVPLPVPLGHDRNYKELEETPISRMHSFRPQSGPAFSFSNPH